MYDYLVVGAGLFGATFAWRAIHAGKKVLVVDSRRHVGGNCYTYYDGGIHVHAYGPHIFHTPDVEVWKFMERFTTFEPYVHRVHAIAKDKRVYSLPINLATLNQVFGVVTPSEAAQQLERVRVPCSDPKNLEQWALSRVGKELYELLFEGYTTKQWGKHPSQLPAGIIKRLPIRFTWDDNYFTDRYQGIPNNGYTDIIERMLDGCEVVLRTDFFNEREKLEKMSKRTVYTGRLDEYYDHIHGTLEHRSVTFSSYEENVPDFQGTSQMNYTDVATAWTRIVEHKHFSRVDLSPARTIVTYEFPEECVLHAVPCYPINTAENDAKQAKYAATATLEQRMVFGGRLASYKYLDMWKVIKDAHELADREGL
jgi:UDP-galactopyranose mutase